MNMLTIERLAHDVRGIAHADGMTWFVEQALPGEVIAAREIARHAQRVDAVADTVITASVMRTEPACEYYGRCGGCDVQHVRHQAQLVLKQQILLDQLARIGGTVPRDILQPLASQPWSYRRRARLACRWSSPQKRLAIGFRERHGQQVVEIAHCVVLEPALQALLLPLRTVLSRWSQPRQLGHVELLLADDGVAVLLRLLESPREQDIALLQAMSSETGVSIFLQAAERGAAEYCCGPLSVLHVSHAASDTVLACVPGDFLQGNAAVNALLIDAVREALFLQADDHVLEAFCGLGNFTLPLAKWVRSVTALELSAGMLARAGEQALRQGIANVTWRACDLEAFVADDSLVSASKLLLDPPRDGAQAFCKQVDLRAVQRLAYVSCNPSTLARDTAILLQRGLMLQSVQLVDMFPQTSHIEALAVFVPATHKPVSKPVSTKQGLKRLRR